MEKILYCSYCGERIKEGEPYKKRGGYSVIHNSCDDVDYKTVNCERCGKALRVKSGSRLRYCDRCKVFIRHVKYKESYYGKNVFSR